MKKLIAVCFVIFSVAFAENPVTAEPAYPTEFDSIVVYFDASKGNQGLNNYSGTDVYAHTGLITEESESGADWQYVWMPWPSSAGDTQANTDANKLTKVSGNIWKLTIGYPHEYFSCPADEKILSLAFVFRNASGSAQGKDEGDADIYLDLYEPGLTALWVDPRPNSDYHISERSPVFISGSSSETISLSASAAALGVPLDSLVLYEGASRKIKSTDDTLHYDLPAAQLAPGMNHLKVVAYGATLADTSDALCIMKYTDKTQARPSGLADGITKNSGSSASFCLFAPGKEHVFLIGDVNGWAVNEDYQLAKDELNADSAWFWITVDDIPEGKMAFQYLVDGELAVADPYSELILDGWNDNWVTESVFPDLPEYPDSLTDFLVGYMDLQKPDFNWTDGAYERPATDELVVYELLIRDFNSAHSYQALIDSINYFKRLGVTAIELMPINEFDGNESWGYNPAFYFAPDKYYGTPEKLKEFVNLCHENGMAVILDMVFNHATGASSMVRLYNEGDYGAPTAENPWYNTSAKHPYNVFNDMNHESAATKYFIDRVNRYWIEEYHIDGYRYDLSKGFTQTYSGSDVGAWGSYDQSRINILTRMANAIWSYDPDAYVILEHFGDAYEEAALASSGMMLWGNSNHNYGEAAMGWMGSSDFSWVYHGSRSWDHARVMGYMESHDEERLAYKNAEYGNNNLSYNIREKSVNMDRLELTSLFFLTLPGPKMIWQFGEVGYDYSIEYGGRTSNKPIRWDYYRDEDRRDLYNFYSILNFLRSEYSVFTDENTGVDLYVGNNVAGKRIRLSGSGPNVVILGNFDINSLSVDPNFYHTGPWYEYFSGDTLNVTGINDGISLEAGEYRLYTDQKLVESPVAVSATDTPAEYALEAAYPNPFNPVTRIEYSIAENDFARISIYDLQGRRIRTLINAVHAPGNYEVSFNASDLPSGVYIYRLETGRYTEARKMCLVK